MEVIRTAFRHKSAAAAALIALGIAIIPSTAQGGETPPWEPVQVGAANADAPSAASPAPAQLQQTAPGGPSLNQGAPADYVIAAGDTLQITVWREPEASVPAAVVRPDGKITLPLINEVEVAGQTSTQAQQRIAEGLAKFITDANVTVVVAAISPKKVYVIGAAQKGGAIPYTYGMTVLQALSEAGGFNDYAKRSKVYILRTENGKGRRLDFNYDKVIKGQNMEQNIPLLPGDTVVIPQ